MSCSAETHIGRTWSAQDEPDSGTRRHSLDNGNDTQSSPFGKDSGLIESVFS